MFAKFAYLKKICLTLIIVLLATFCNKSYAAEITSLRIGQGIRDVRIVLDAEADFNYNVFLLTSPKRLVLDVDKILVNKTIEKVKDANNIIGNIRVGEPDNGKIRIVFDLLKPVTVKKVFMLEPQSTFKWRLAIDITTASEKMFMSKIGIGNAIGDKRITPQSTRETGNNIAISAKNNNHKKKIIVIDPGHGGKDPGAIGRSGVYEKTLTLAMSKELKKQLEAKGKYKVYLTRSTDIFIPLRDRVKIARKYEADLFVSIHADSAPNKNAKGLSVYTLSETASDKEAQALADRENKADVISGLNLVEQSQEVSDVLISLAQRETRNRSSEFARCMETQMRKSVRLVSDAHRFAGFAVLKAPDVPSVLLEMGYLSNREEEKLLKQASYRKKLSALTVKAIDKYFLDMQHKSLF